MTFPLRSICVMAEASASGETSKRPKLDDEENDEWVGPMPSEAAQPKRKKGTYLFKLFMLSFLLFFQWERGCFDFFTCLKVEEELVSHLLSRDIITYDCTVFSEHQFYFRFVLAICDYVEYLFNLPFFSSSIWETLPWQLTKFRSLWEKLYAQRCHNPRHCHQVSKNSPLNVQIT